jgi:CIC family chloride channel protein
MGTFFAGVFRAPMTSVFMVFEVSASYMIILPVMIANTISYVIARRFQRVPFFQMHAKEEGLDLPSVEAERETRRLLVEDAMQQPHAVFGPKTRGKTAAELMRKAGDTFRLVKTGHGKWSWVRLEELDQAVEEGRGESPLEKIVRRPPAPGLYRDIGLDNALKVIGGHPILPVSSRANINELVGTLTLNDIHLVYGITPSDIEDGAVGRE